MLGEDTIVAIATPQGRSGIGVIRLSGPSSLALTRELLGDPTYNPQPRQAILKPIFDPLTKSIIDQSLITYFKSPHSFTGEDVVELSCHGSPNLLLHIVDVLLSLGARSANAGEFTLRALSNGRLNLSQAEAVRDLIDAQTLEAVRQAARQLNGELSLCLQPFKESLLRIIVPLESSLEFVEDDLPANIVDKIVADLSTLTGEIDGLTKTFRTGRLLNQGIRITLIGKPNVGKSSIFNRLAASDRAIVTDIPGTTRDTITESISIEGIPVTITDTAGIRYSVDRIEQLGIERTRRAIADADLSIAVLDGSQSITDEDREIVLNLQDKPSLLIINKADIETYKADLSFLSCNLPVVNISALTGYGFDALRKAIVNSVTDNESLSGHFLITNARHYDLLQRAASAIRSSEILLKENASEELVLVGLYDALRFLGEITGETTPDDILSQIFATFCIGK